MNQRVEVDHLVKHIICATKSSFPKLSMNDMFRQNGNVDVAFLKKQGDRFFWLVGVAILFSIPAMPKIVQILFS